MTRIERAAARDIVDFVLDDPLNVREEMIDFAEARIGADCADYKARIKELEHRLAGGAQRWRAFHAPGLRHHWGIEIEDYAGDDNEGTVIYATQGIPEHTTKEVAATHNALVARIAELEAQLPTTSPTDAPASDTRGLAVEIDDEMVEHAKRSADSFYLPGDSEERRYIRDILSAVAPLILRKALPSTDGEASHARSSMRT